METKRLANDIKKAEKDRNDEQKVLATQLWSSYISMLGQDSDTNANNI